MQSMDIREMKILHHIIVTKIRKIKNTPCFAKFMKFPRLSKILTSTPSNRSVQVLR